MCRLGLEETLEKHRGEARSGEVEIGDGHGGHHGIYCPAPALSFGMGGDG